MALSSAWCTALPLWLLWGAACSIAVSGDDTAFLFDIEGSSAVGRQDLPETSKPRLTPEPLPPAAQVHCVATLLGVCALGCAIALSLSLSTPSSLPPSLPVSLSLSLPFFLLPSLPLLLSLH